MATLAELVQKVRRYTRDTTGSLFTQEDVVDFINEGIQRVRKIPELKKMKTLSNNGDEPILLPEEYHYLTSVYGASRCFVQDEQHYQASQFMNEFETKLLELERAISNGSVIITDENGDVVVETGADDSVKDVYFTRIYVSFDGGDE